MSLEGQHLGEFEVVERIGQGGMGAVYKAVQTSLQRTVVIKTLQPALAADPEYIERFHREAIAAAGLSHQNLVQVYAAGETDGIHWFAMEFVKGESAQVRLKRKGYIEPGEAIAIGVRLANALDYAWSRAGLIHRDIKPDNIFLSGDGDVKLGDLGLAKMADQTQTQALTVTGASMGTPYYVSPEQAEGRKDIDLRADIYSLGCTLYRLVSGQPPFTGDNAVTVMMKHVTSPPPDVRGVFPACPPVLAEVILKMMQKDPSARQQSYDEVHADLRRAFDELNATAVPVVSPRAVAAQRPGAVAKKAGVPAVAWVGGAVALLAAIAALVYFAPWKKGDSAPPADGVKSGPIRVNPARSDLSNPPAAASSTANAVTAATKDAPFVNTLGMKFVPVPIVSGPTAGQRVLFSVWDTRVQDYAAYAGAKKVDDSWTKQAEDGGPTGRELNHPVMGVSWEDAQGFCQWLTEKERAEGKLPKGVNYRLPTDEEWSWAVGMPPELGGTPAEKSGKNSVDFPWGHAYGLYDMDVWQWCEDWLDASHKHRVLRGASSALDGSGALLSSLRGHLTPGTRDAYCGFRCVVGASARQAGRGFPLFFVPLSLFSSAAQRREFFMDFRRAARGEAKAA